MTPLVQMIDVKKHFKVRDGWLHAVDGVNFSIAQGQTLGIVGESGCGKSTLGRVVLRLLEPTAGQVLLDGQDILAYSPKQMRQVRQRMQIIFQDPFSSLNPRMPVFDLIAEPLVMNRITKTKAELTVRVLRLMEMVGLAERYINTYPHEMDGGRRQRVGVARALALNPQFVVCDEPVSALDVSIQAQILNLLMDLQEELGLTYMFITHDLSVVKHISDQIAVMYLGQCVELCDSDTLFKNPMHPYTKSLLAAIPVPRLVENAVDNIIRGEVSDPINPAAACRFLSRCDFSVPGCSGGNVPLVDRGGGHHVACRLYD